MFRKANARAVVDPGVLRDDCSSAPLDSDRRSPPRRTAGAPAREVAVPEEGGGYALLAGLVTQFAPEPKLFGIPCVSVATEQ